MVFPHPGFGTATTRVRPRCCAHGRETDPMSRPSRPTSKAVEHGQSAREVVHPNAAGIDVGAETSYVAVPTDRAQPAVRSFGCFTEDLHAMAEWLEACGVDTVAMESTGVYWIPLFQVL